jgi:hypothetical protein
VGRKNREARRHSAVVSSNRLVNHAAQGPVAPQRQQTVRRDAAIRWCEFGLCMAITACVIALHFVFWNHRGGLWRDEVQNVNLGLSPTLAVYWKDLAIDTFPALWHATVRAWSWIAGASDGSLQLLGLLIGLSIVGAVWWAVWRVGSGFPLLTIALFGLCPTVIRYGDSLRGYGLGLLLLLVMYAEVWRAASAPTWPRIGVALVTALLAVHANYFNAVVLLALGAASAALAVWRRDWKPVACVVGIGVLAAISLLPFADPLSRQKEWHDIIRYDVSISWFIQKLTNSMNAAGVFACWVWLGIALVVVAAVVIDTTVRSLRSQREVRRDAGLFAAAVILAGIAGYLVFLFATRQPTNVWYYMPLMAFLGISFDVGFEGSLLASPLGRVIRLIGVAALVAVTMPTAWSAMEVRMTNVDLVAQVLEKSSDKDDLIVVASWWPGVSLSRYYHGAAPWTTVPDLGPLRVQRYDVFKQRMGEKEPMRAVRDRIVATLRGGHRVWLVNWPIINWPIAKWPTVNLTALQLGLRAEPQSPPPLPAGPMEENPYLSAWFLQAAYDMFHNAEHAEVVPVESRDPVSEMENPILLRFDGRP